LAHPLAVDEPTAPRAVGKKEDAPELQKRSGASSLHIGVVVVLLRPDRRRCEAPSSSPAGRTVTALVDAPVSRSYDDRGDFSRRARR
jgi:hypothetical protein